MNKYTVYKHTSPSGKVYIGITCQKPEARWGGNGSGYKHSPHFMAAINKYGWNNFKHEIICSGLSQEEAESKEIELIRSHKSTDKRFGYNVEFGGIRSPKHSPETRAKISDANRRRVWTPESKQKMRDYKKAHPTTAETARKIGDANRGRKHRPESVEKIRAAQHKKPVVNLTAGVEYLSVSEAARASHLDPSKIVACCKGRRNYHGGCAWAYKEVIS